MREVSLEEQNLHILKLPSIGSFVIVWNHAKAKRRITSLKGNSGQMKL